MNTYAYGVILIVDMCIRTDYYIAPYAHVNSAMRHLTTLGYALLCMALCANYMVRSTSYQRGEEEF